MRLRSSETNPPSDKENEIIPLQVQDQSKKNNQGDGSNSAASLTYRELFVMLTTITVLLLSRK